MNSLRELGDNLREDLPPSYASMYELNLSTQSNDLSIANTNPSTQTLSSAMCSHSTENCNIRLAHEAAIGTL